MSYLINYEPCKKCAYFAGEKISLPKELASNEFRKEFNNNPSNYWEIAQLYNVAEDLKWEHVCLHCS